MFGDQEHDEADLIRDEDLTDAEWRVAEAVARGLSNKEIAAELFIHYRTVENHRTSICGKLDLHGPNTLLRFALQHKSEL